MRISDWSSDVCSSDLWPIAAAARRAPAIPTATTGHRGRIDGRPGRPAGAARRSGACSATPVPADKYLPAARRPGHPEERKSVVSGKSVSGRVGLGGDRTIKKKKDRRKKNAAHK